MGAKREPRFDSHLTVQVAGLDVNGNCFKQTATVDNISRRGGRISEVRCLRGPGDVVQIEHRGRRAQFRVVWIDVVSGHVGVCCTDESCIWKGKLPDWVFTVPPQSLSSQSTPAPPAEMRQPEIAAPSAAGELSATARAQGRVDRKHPRYRCMGGVTATTKGVPNRVWGRLTVIGIGGCYVETASPFKPDTTLELLIGAHGLELRLRGEVRCVHPRLGMGIMFTGLDEEQCSVLDRLVALASGRR